MARYTAEEASSSIAADERLEAGLPLIVAVAEAVDTAGSVA